MLANLDKHDRLAEVKNLVYFDMFDPAPEETINSLKGKGY